MKIAIIVGLGLGLLAGTAGAEVTKTKDGQGNDKFVLTCADGHKDTLNKAPMKEIQVKICTDHGGPKAVADQKAKQKPGDGPKPGQKPAPGEGPKPGQKPGEKPATASE
ncbi:MAG: hypothetical protein ABJO27_20405 [Pseudoruegeria sp.]